MNWLLWKEYRVNRVIVFFTLFLLLFPYLIAVYGVLWYGHRGVQWGDSLSVAGFYSLLLSQAGLALIGGSLIAGERADRSAEFQVCLPLPREKLLAGKLLLALAIAAVIWLTNPLILWSLADQPSISARGLPWRYSPFLLQALSNTAITGLTFFCVAWLSSSFLQSPTFSVCAGLITPLLVFSGLIFATYFVGMYESTMVAFVEPFYRGICLVTALASFAVGTWFYLRRVEP